MLKLTTNLKKQIAAVANMEKLNQVVVAQALRDVARYAAKQSATAVRDTRYSTTPLDIIQSKIYRKSRVGKNMPISSQSSETGVRGGDIPVFYMRPKNRKVKTRLGMRWGVAVGRGAGAPAKAFHLKSRGPGKLVGAGGQAFDRHSKLFTRNEDGSLKAVKFKTFSEVMIGSGKDRAVVDKSAVWLDNRITRLWKQYLYQVTRAQSLG